MNGLTLKPTTFRLASMSRTASMTAAFNSHLAGYSGSLLLCPSWMYCLHVLHVSLSSLLRLTAILPGYPGYISCWISPTNLLARLRVSCLSLFVPSLFHFIHSFMFLLSARQLKGSNTPWFTLPYAPRSLAACKTLLEQYESNWCWTQFYEYKIVAA